MSDLFEDPYETAAKQSLHVVLPRGNELFVDIDDPNDEEWLAQMLAVLDHNGFDLVETHRTTSQGGGTHVYLESRVGLSDTERIALQACLGSDRKRELLSLLRIFIARSGKEKRVPTTFFETDDAVSDHFFDGRVSEG